MKKLHIFFIIIFLICISLLANGQKKNIAYSDSSNSKIVVTKLDSTKGGIVFSIMETNYSIEYLTINGESAYFAVKKSSELGGGNESMKLVYHHLISVDFIPLTDTTLKSFSIKCNCDEIVLHPNFLETITYGCCGGANVMTYYSYENQKEIVESDMGIIHYRIQHPTMDFYIGFSTESHGLADNRGALYIGYSTGELYKIKIISPFYPPKIKVITGNPNDLIDSTHYGPSQIYSSDKIHSVDQINNLKISLVFKEYPYDNTANENIVDIPIISGKPFGKDEKEQTINILEKK